MHKLRAEISTIYICDCEASFADIAEAAEHLRSELAARAPRIVVDNGEGEFNCECGRRFKSAQAIAVHRARSHRETFGEPVSVE